MSAGLEPRRYIVTDAIYGILNPIPYGCFVAALIFDIIYSVSGVMQWVKAAAWLIVFGLLFAVAPRLINLVQVWITRRGTARGADRMAFWLNCIAVIIAVTNEFVHSRDAYAVVPAGVWLSVFTVLPLLLGQVLVATSRTSLSGVSHG